MWTLLQRFNLKEMFNIINILSSWGVISQVYLFINSKIKISDAERNWTLVYNSNYINPITLQPYGPLRVKMIIKLDVTLPISD